VRLNFQSFSKTAPRGPKRGYIFSNQGQSDAEIDQSIKGKFKQAIINLCLDSFTVENKKEKRILSSEPKNQRLFLMLEKSKFKKNAGHRRVLSPQNNWNATMRSPGQDRYNPNVLNKAFSDPLDIPDSKRFMINDEADGAITRTFSQGAKNSNGKVSSSESSVSEERSVRRKKRTTRKLNVRNLRRSEI